MTDAANHLAVAIRDTINEAVQAALKAQSTTPTVGQGPHDQRVRQGHVVTTIDAKGPPTMSLTGYCSSSK
jgi:hypothetical protein